MRQPRPMPRQARFAVARIYDRANVGKASDGQPCAPRTGHEASLTTRARRAGGKGLRRCCAAIGFAWLLAAALWLRGAEKAGRGDAALKTLAGRTVEVVRRSQSVAGTQDALSRHQ